ncbi:adenine deaminase C-terminal domain-containing protein [Natronosalvus halobius]|uniref:adenine deaminase C-terminal domain-containing protein n=1 Tax=Natronosalvus halobius TaxID=2953746 RepID=UPI0020A01955|nr:adenine deaminase C-terminal domain-containing protein [Natronosalvus halobius]USZ73611.1 amidohydrolase family protein [Natronosalvus halobius]
MSELRAVARGDQPADLVLRGGRVFDPVTETYERGDLLVADGRIASLTLDSSASIGPDTNVLDVADCHVLPGFIDVHTHLDTFQAFERAFRHALAGGTTTVVTETDRFAMRFGRAGIELLLDATADLPVTVFGTLPAGPFYRDVAGRRLSDIDLDDIADLASDDRIVGAGEVFWNYAIERSDETPLTTLFEAVRNHGGVICGHGAGCNDEKLTAFATEIDNDHEILKAEDVGERLRRGVVPIGRYGSIRDDIDAFAAGTEGVPAGELCLCSDGMWPRELVEDGYMDAVVRRAVEAGIEPTRAFRMVTLNAARHFGLTDRGSLTPGSVADIVVLGDEQTVDVRTVISSGSVVVQDGEVRCTDRPFDYPERVRNSVTVDVTEDRFRVDAAGGGAVAAIDYEEGLLSSETRVEPPIIDGEYRAAPDHDLLKAALLPGSATRRDGGFTGFVTGLMLQTGAVATSDTWGSPGVLTVGTTAAEMTAAARRVAELGGGWVVVEDGEPVAELPTPIAGVCSEDAVERTRDLAEAVRGALSARGMTASQPLLALGTLSAVGMPWFKLATGGYVDVIANEVVNLRPE